MSLVERWLPVVGYEGLYEVSDLGRVRSLARPAKCVLRGKTINVTRDGKLLKQRCQKGRYWSVGLCRDWKVKYCTVHRLVLEAFVSPCPEGMEGCHGPNGKDDNSLTNLRWDTRKANNQDRVKAGSSKGVRNPNCRLSETDVLDIRSRLANDPTSSYRIATDYGISGRMVYRIRARLAWSHLP